MDRSFFIEFFIVKHSSFFIGKAPPVASRKPEGGPPLLHLMVSC
jgi:hypothetical protein